MESKQCPVCHSPIPENAPGGLCPACVLRGAEEIPAPGPAAPSIAEIAAAFPRLELVGLIGQGGMGFVYQARQPDLDRTVALKILAPELSGDPAFAERFAREARTLGKLNHPNIVTVFEHGESGGLFYLIMEYVDGVNLRQAMRAGRFNPEQALAIVPGICDALQAAHAQGVWHRDIKPENILLDRDGKVKIADFGIARIVGDPQQDFTLTMTGNALGSAAYMAPEQHEKPHDVDHRADIYSLGVVIYEMLTGELPLGRFPAPSSKAAVDARIDEIVLKTLEKEREMRQQSAAEVKTDVQRARCEAAPSVRHASPLQAGRVGLLLGSAIALGVIAIILGSPRWRFTSETARDFSQLLLGLSITFSVICSVLVVYRSRPGRIVGILGAALAGLVLLLMIEGRGAITLALWAAALIAIGAAGAWLLSDRKTKEVNASKENPKRPADPARSGHRDLQPPTSQPSGLARLAFGLLLAGVLGVPLLAAMGSREHLAVAFGAIAVILAFVLALMSWRERMGKTVAISSAVLIVTSIAMVAIRDYQMRHMRIAQRERAREAMLQAATRNENPSADGLAPPQPHPSQNYNYSTPKNTMESMIKAAKQGDEEAFKRGVSNGLLKMMEAETSDWSEPMRDIAKVSYAGQVSQEGEVAVVDVRSTDPERMQPVRLVRENGEWKLTLPGK